MTNSEGRPASQQSSSLKGISLALFAFALYATHDAAIKKLGATYSPFQIVFFVVLLGFPVVTVMLLRSTTVDTLRPHLPIWIALRTAGVVVASFCAFYAFSVLPLAETYAILFTTPLLITVLSIPILGEVVRRHRWFAVFAGLIGVMVVLRPGSSELELGHIAALVAAFCGAFSAVIMRKVGKIERREVLLLYPLLANFIVMLCALPFVYIPMPLQDLGLMLLVSVLAIIAMSLMIRAYTLADAAIVAPMQYSQIIWATLFGWLFFDETSNVMTFVGAGIIIASGAYVVFRERGESASGNQPVLRSLSRRPEMGAAPRLSVASETLRHTVETPDR